MEKLAQRFTKQELTNIITNSHNQVAARKTLQSVLKEEPEQREVSDENDFSPDPSKMQEIRERVYAQPTELCLSMHRQLLKILGAPTRQLFYDLIEQFYLSLKRFEDEIKEELEEVESLSQKNSTHMKKMLEDSY
jgi:hypothetical protein